MLLGIVVGVVVTAPAGSARAQAGADAGTPAAPPTAAAGPSTNGPSPGAAATSSSAASSSAGTAPARASHPAASTVSAAPSAADLATAKKRYNDGEKKYKAGDFAGALAEFQAADDIKPTPHAERYLGLCEDALGHFAAAVDWYERFLGHVPEKLNGQADEARKRVAEIKAMPGKVHVESTPAGAAVAIDGKPEATPAPLDLELAPGAHTIAFQAPGHVPLEKTVDVAFASTQTISGELAIEPPAAAPPPPVAVTPASTAPPSPPPPVEPRSKVPAYVTGALAIAAAGVGTVFGALALKDKSDFDKNPTTQTADNGDTHSLIADMSFGVAITFAVTSVVLFTTKDVPSAEEPRPVKSANGSLPREARAPDDSSARRPLTSWAPTTWASSHGGGAGVLVHF